MIRRPPRSKRTDTLFPYTTLFRAGAFGVFLEIHRFSSSSAALDPQPPLRRQVAGRAPHAGNVGSRRAGNKWRLADSRPDFIAVGQPTTEIGRAHVELQSLMRISYAVFCLKKKNKKKNQ